MPQISNSAILAAAGKLTEANAAAQQARENIATPPAVDSASHPAPAPAESSSGVGTHLAGGAG